jgi:uncharacterized protein DUF5941
MTVTTAVEGFPRAVAGWAARRLVSPGALTGIALALSGCAAVWFSAGTRSAAIAGGCVLCCGFLVTCAGGQLAARAAAATGDGAPMAAVTGGDRPTVAVTGGWLAAWVAGEFGVYAGLAVGAPAAGERRAWALASAAMILLTLRVAAAGCHALVRPGRPRPAGHALGAQTVLIAVAAPAGGPAVTLAVLVGWGACALGWQCLAAGRLAPATAGPADSAVGGMAGVVACRDDGPLAQRAGRLVRGLVVPLPPALAGLTATAMLAGSGMHGLPGVLLLAPVAAMLLAAPGAGHPHDGRLDWLVPAALHAGQCVYLAALGFAVGVPPPLTFALVGVLALRHLHAVARTRAAAGPPPRSARSGPHRTGLGPGGLGAVWERRGPGWERRGLGQRASAQDAGRLGASGQGASELGTSRLGASGQGASGLDWQRRTLGRQRHRLGRERCGLGWDGRMLAVGLAATVPGLAAFAYLTLTAYLGWLLCRSGLPGWLEVGEEER